MAAIATEDAWMEKCLVEICPIGGTAQTFGALTETIDFDIGDKDIEGVALVNGGRVRKWSPQADTTITMEAYPLFAGTPSGSTGKGYFGLQHTEDASAPVRITNDFKRAKCRMLFLWTNDPTPTTAGAATADTFSAIRLGFCDVIITSVKASFTDGILKFTIIGKCTAFDKSASSNLLAESVEGASGTDILPSIAAYTTSYKFA